MIRNILAVAVLAVSLAGCAATPPATGGMSKMKMDHSQCKDMMKKKECGCCKKMQEQKDMRTFGMMTGGAEPMMCKRHMEEKPAKK